MESFLNTDTYCRLLTFAIFILLGFDLSKSAPRPKSKYSWLLLVSVIAFTGYLTMEIESVSVVGYNVYLNEVILGLFAGLVAGFVIHSRPKIKMRQP